MASAGDERTEELRRVYRAHVRAVFAMFAYTTGADVAEDLTSLTFEHVVRAWDRFDVRRGSERTWIIAIARNVLRDHFRRQTHPRPISTDEHPAVLDSLLASDEPLARLLTVEALKDWLGALGERDRLVLALRFGADLSAPEIAAATGLSVPNVHQIVSRSLKHLRVLAEPERAGVSDSA
jgi:RNA polymerase sigma-70 factor (ECF subfamily)